MSVFNYIIADTDVKRLMTSVDYDGRNILNRMVTAKIERCQGYTADELNAAGKTGLKEKDGVLYNPHGLFVSNHYGGKMMGITGISGFAGNCKECLSRAQVPNSVCAKCFSLKGSKFINLPAWTKNDVILSTRKLKTGEFVLDPEKIPELRYSTHGEIINPLHAYNYLTCAETNPGTQFCVWTKNNNYYKAGLAMYNTVYGDKPANFRVFYSCERLDVYPSESVLRTLKKAGYDAYFCVYSTWKKQERAINAGAHRCLCSDGSCKYKCHFCYDYYTKWPGTGSDKAVWIAEILNGERHKE